MILNVTDVLTAEGRTESRQAELGISTVRYGEEQYAVTEKSPVSMTVSNVGKGRAQVRGSVNLTVLLRCDRCLKEVPYTFSLEFSSTVISPELEETVSEEEESIVGYQVDVDELVFNEIIIHWPMKILCRPDCKGICGVCGKDLNEGACECDTFVPDPRLAAIRDIFNGDKEVE